MAKPIANLRLFVAAYPPVGAAQRMIEAIAEARLPPHRMTPLEQVHLTLQFIGDTPARALDDTIESMKRAAAGITAFVLVPRRLISLPKRGAARLVACETDSPTPLGELHRRLVTRLARQPRNRHADRFTPHLTLCRFNPPAPIPPIDLPVDAHPFPITRVALMRSTLAAAGATHHEVAAVNLESAR